MEAIILFVLVFIAIFCGIPVAIALGGVSTIFGLFTVGLDFFNLLPSRIFGVMTNFLLLAIPLFIFMGAILERSGIAEGMLESLSVVFGRLRGGLAIAIVFVGVILGASTGIVGASVTTLTLLSLPIMLKQNYSQELSTGVIVASGTLGQIVPPSIVMILLASVMNTPVGDMFLAAIIPSLILAGLYLVVIVFKSIFSPHQAPGLSKEEILRIKGDRFAIKLIQSLLMPFLLIVGVLGSIFSGIASPTEAAGVGAFLALCLAAYNKKLSWENVKKSSITTVTITGMIFGLLFGASVFGLVFRGVEGDVFFTNLILEYQLSSAQFILLVMVVTFVLGFFIDFIEIVFIIVPIVTPVFLYLGVDMLWLGILFTINLQTSFLTPPFGFSLFYLKGAAPPSVSTSAIYRGVVPFVIVQVLVLIFCYFFPGITKVF